MNEFEFNELENMETENMEIGQEQTQETEVYSYDYSEADTNVQMQPEVKERVFLGILGAFLGSIIGVVFIVVLGQLGYIASISGVVMGICVLKGYILLGKKLSVKGIIITSILMIIMVFYSQIISYGIAVAQVYEVDFVTGMYAIPLLMEEGGIDVGMYTKELGMLYLFTALGAVPTIKKYLRK